MILLGILAAIFFASVAMLVREGLWSNTLTLINTVTAALIATSVWEPVANWLEGTIGESYTYLVDFIAIWMVFCICFIVFRAITDQVSKTAVRFKGPVNTIGGGLMAAWIGWVMVCFTTMTFHMAPLAPHFMNGAFYPEPKTNVFLGMAPDRQWLGFVQQVSQGSLSNAPPKGVAGEDEANVFDPRGEFIFKYYQRREKFAAEPEFRVR